MPSEVASQILQFLAAYTPEVAAQLTQARRELRAAFPRGYELVFDNYNALVFAISPTERSADAFVSVAGYPRWVTLFFLHGAELDDPEGLLEGRGKQVRSIRLTTGKELSTKAIQTLLAHATGPHAAALKAAPKLSTTLKTALAKPRARRPKAAPGVKLRPSGKSGSRLEARSPKA